MSEVAPSEPRIELLDLAFDIVEQGLQAALPTAQSKAKYGSWFDATVERFVFSFYHGNISASSAYIIIIIVIESVIMAHKTSRTSTQKVHCRMTRHLVWDSAKKYVVDRTADYDS